MPHSLDSVLLHCEECAENIRNLLDIDSLISLEKSIDIFLGRNKLKLKINQLSGLNKPIFEYEKNKFVMNLYISKHFYYSIIRVDGITSSYARLAFND